MLAPRSDVDGRNPISLKNSARRQSLHHRSGRCLSVRCVDAERTTLARPSGFPPPAERLIYGTTWRPSVAALRSPPPKVTATVIAGEGLVSFKPNFESVPNPIIDLAERRGTKVKRSLPPVKFGDGAARVVEAKTALVGQHIGALPSGWRKREGSIPECPDALCP